MAIDLMQNTGIVSKVMMQFCTRKCHDFSDKPTANPNEPNIEVICKYTKHQLFSPVFSLENKLKIERGRKGRQHNGYKNEFHAEVLKSQIQSPAPASYTMLWY